MNYKYLEFTYMYIFGGLISCHSYIAPHLHMGKHNSQHINTNLMMTLFLPT